MSPLGSKTKRRALHAKNIALSTFAMLMIGYSASGERVCNCSMKGWMLWVFHAGKKFRIHRMHHMERTACFFSRTVEEV